LWVPRLWNLSRKRAKLQKLHRKINQNLFGPYFFFVVFKELKKRKVMYSIRLLLFYGRFLRVSTASIAPIMTITITITATPNSTVPVDAKPDTGEAVGAVVAVGGLA